MAFILAACGSSMDDVVKAHVHLNDIRDFERFSQVYRRHFSDPKPARTTVGSTLENIMVEIDVIAYRKPKAVAP